MDHRHTKRRPEKFILGFNQLFPPSEVREMDSSLVNNDALISHYFARCVYIQPLSLELGDGKFPGNSLCVSPYCGSILA